MSYVHLDVEGEVALIRLQRPEKRNILNSTLIEQAQHTIARLSAMNGVAVAILTGEGPSFCAGADLHEMQEFTSGTAESFITRLHNLFDAIRLAPQVVIAAINGHALGAGCELVAACDIRIASDDAVFGMPEIRVGIPSVIEAALLVPLVGLGRAAEMVYTGELLGATEARECGLVNRVVSADQLLDESLALARRLAAFSHSALRLQKRLVRNWTTKPVEESILFSVPRFAAAFEGPDPREGMRAFLEHREPRYQHGTSPVKD